MISDYELMIPGLRLWITLGCSKEERANVQPVDVNISFQYNLEPLGCQSDQLNDVICYDTLSKSIIEAVKGQSFNLIEFLAARIFEIISHHVRKMDAFIEILVTKPNHPVIDVQKAISFRYRRRLPQKSLLP